MTPRKNDDDFQGIPDAELELLHVLWDEGPATPSDLRQRLEDDGKERAYTTVQTLLHRLLRKGYVTREREGVAQIYTAAVDRDAVVRAHMDELAGRLGDGSTSSLVFSLVQGGRLSKRDIARFRALLDEAEAGMDTRRRGRRRR